MPFWLYKGALLRLCYLRILLTSQPIINTTRTIIINAVHIPARKMSPISWHPDMVTASSAIRLKKYNLKFFIVLVFVSFLCPLPLVNEG
jgi:hypothetical protein